MVGQNHPTIWKLITKIRYEIAADRAKLALNELGEQLIKIKKKKMEIRLNALCTRFAENKIELEDFLKAIAQNI
ncbi:Uncharacterized protein FWK35_00032708 [Aphis craccivora]|uniref:Uncharacterized protein n=1 Tax=Aphis craccivora TaxID=307492 RepID=A0A6G0VN57_APHCR|nr:Uncharacterized protein FWK35_00032708 [Aphis craccivora]